MRNKTILVVDDDDALRISLARGLRNMGFYVLTSESADSADNILSRINVDAIVLDRMMTGMDGLTFLKELRNSGNRTPTIMLTAMSGPENTIAGLSAGADDYLAKPFQIQELALRLNNIIQRNVIPTPKMPENLYVSEDEFFIKTPTGETNALYLSGEEKKLLYGLVSPIGNIVAAQPMVAKRLRNKLNNVLSNLDIITIRGHGYKMICLKPNK